MEVARRPMTTEERRVAYATEWQRIVDDETTIHRVSTRLGVVCPCDYCSTLSPFAIYDKWDKQIKDILRHD